MREPRPSENLAIELCRSVGVAPVERFKNALCE